MTESAPAAIAFVASPENLIPPSEISGTLDPRVARAQSAMAVIWGTPAPLTTRGQDRSGSDAHLDSVRAQVDQIPRAFVSRHIARDHGLAQYDHEKQVHDDAHVGRHVIEHRHQPGALCGGTAEAVRPEMNRAGKLLANVRHNQEDRAGQSFSTQK